MVTDQDLAEGDIRLVDSLGISLWDSAGAIVIEDTFGILHDRMNYGEYFGLDARNAFVATASLGNLGDREPMQAVYRTAGLSRPIGGISPQVLVITTTGTMAGEVSLLPLPTGYTGSETGTYALERGGTAYEFTNHLGNVLAVVSDKKLGQDTDTDMHAEYYHPETMMLTDYYPFGSPMVGRMWQSGTYRYGFQGQEGDDEVVGEGNALTAKFWEYDSRLGRRWNVDPESIGLFSEYICFSLNPIFRIDPLGDDDYIVNRQGYVTLLRKTGGNEDRIFNFDRSKSMLLPKEFVLGYVHDDYFRDKGKYNVQVIKSNYINIGRRLFKFLADNTDVEWSFAEFKSNSRAFCHIATSHSPNHVYPGEFIYYELAIDDSIRLIYHCHSHPGTFNEKSGWPAYPSGFTYNLIPKYGRDPHGDRSFYDGFNEKYGKSRIPATFDIYVPSKPDITVKYNQEKVFRQSNSQKIENGKEE